MCFIRCSEYLMRKLDGFSLMEASLALTIMGLVSVVGLGAIKRWRQQQQMAITQNHQEQILTAVALYGSRVGHFPYPADPKASMDTFGFERVPEGVPRDQVGIVPYRTIGVPEAVAKDGYGRYFTYVGGSPPARDICATEPLFPVSISQRLSNGALQAMHTDSADPIAIVLITHGANGYGAWEGGMGRVHQRLSGKHGPDEHANAKATQHFIVAPLSYEARTYNDDYVLWITGNHLLAMYVKVICKPFERPMA
jgi:hypothetical protein